MLTRLLVGFGPRNSSVSQSLILFTGSPEPKAGVRPIGSHFFLSLTANNAKGT